MGGKPKDPDYYKKHYAKNKESYLQAAREYYGRNKEYHQQRTTEYKKAHPEWTRFNQAKQNARRRGIEFTITLEDIVIPELCPYLKIPLTFIHGKGRVNSNISLDRIDSTKGYIKGNVQVISDLANRMKNSATPEQLEQFAKSILRIE